MVVVATKTNYVVYSMKKRASRQTSNNVQKPNSQSLEKIVAKNEEQKEFIRAIVDNKIVFCTGTPGAGKSFLSMGIACEHLLRGDISNIIVTRPLVATGGKFPALPGTMDEKLDPYWLQMRCYADRFLGKALATQMITDRTIQFFPMELMRGLSLDNTYLICDEVQSISKEQLIMLLTRLGQNSKILLLGDPYQSDVKCPILEQSMMKLENIDDIGFCHLEKCLRPKIVSDIYNALR